MSGMQASRRGYHACALVCLKLNNAWKVHFNQLQVGTVHNVSFLEIIDRASLEKTSFDLFAMMVSAIWMRRNKVRLGIAAVPLG